MKVQCKKLFLSLACLLSLIFLVGSASATNLVVNGDFESGNTGFTSAYSYVADKNQFGGLWDPAKYTVGGNPNDYHFYWASFGPEEGANMMILNGATDPDVDVWRQTVPVATNTIYFFSAWVASSDPKNPTQLDFFINGVSIGSFTASTTTGLWQQFFVTWNSGGNTTADLALVNENTFFGGNDFVLDNIIMSTDNPVPVPSTVLLLGSGLAGLGLLRRKWSLKR